MTAALPLDRAPHEWLAGFPSPKRFADYEPLELTLDDEKDLPYQPMQVTDKKEWGKVATSTKEAVNYYRMPGTKG